MERKRQLESILLDPVPLVKRIDDEETWRFLVSLSPYIEKMRGFDQRNPYHKYDLLYHTVHTVDGVIQRNLDDDVYRLLKTAAFFHDIGKIDACEERYDARGVFLRCTYRMHPEIGRKIAEPILKDLGYEGTELNKILFFIEAHDIFMHFVLPAESNRPNRNKNVINHRNTRMVMNRYIERTDLSGVCYQWFEELIPLCVGDAFAHADIVFIGDLVVDSSKHMAFKYSLITKMIREIEQNG